MTRVINFFLSPLFNVKFYFFFYLRFFLFLSYKFVNRIIKINVLTISVKLWYSESWENTYTIYDTYNLQFAFQNPPGKVPLNDRTQNGILNGTEEGYDSTATILTWKSLANSRLHKQPRRPCNAAYDKKYWINGPPLCLLTRNHHFGMACFIVICGLKMWVGY